MKNKLTILDFSEYENPFDPRSDALLKGAAEAAGMNSGILNYSKEAIPEVDSAKIWMRYDIRSRSDLKWVLEVATTLKRRGHRIFPSPKAIWLAEDKWETFMTLDKAGIPLPTTFRSKDLLKCGFPAILKTRVGWGSMGNRVILEEKAIASLTPYRKDDYICQRFIPHERTFIIALAGEAELACLVDTGRTMADEEKVAPVQAPPGAYIMARKAAEVIGLPAGTVDLIESQDGLKVLEVNSAPRITYPHIPGLDLATPMVKAVLSEMNRE